MTTSLLTASTIQGKFIEEQEYINRYVDFLQYKTAIFDSEIRDLTNLLEKYEFPKIENKRNWTLHNTPLSYDELKKLNDQIQPLIADLKGKIKNAEKVLKTTEEPIELGRIDGRSAQGELIEYFLNNLENDFSPQNIEIARSELLEQIKINERELSPDDESLYTKEMIDYAIKAALFIERERHFFELISIEEKIDELNFNIRMLNPNAEVNVLRQGFIILMTIFDATIFDIMRIALKKDFFKLISVFGKQEKIALKELTDYISFEDFRDKIIEEQIKTKYLKDLLFILGHLNVSCVDDSIGDNFIQLIELVQRRNIHIHNRGIIDEKYLEKDDSGKPKYNFYNLSINNIAEIDKNYLETANRLCKNCVIYVANWADSLPN